ncbi:hypothetical protein T07_2508 [Trichinella nelsoni]|uniref:Uncharacterized protein n=1 Tax=Trichinella nelsoni TaxID=6336 RepID=A0A0V0S9R1_9BILA|nr:hypothetical protein T07_2508 [Trichinella nelsoni]
MDKFQLKMTPIDHVEAFNPEKSVMLDKFMSKAWSFTSNHMAFINDEEKRKNDDTPQHDRVLLVTNSYHYACIITLPSCAMGKLHRFRGVLDMLYTNRTDLVPFNAEKIANAKTACTGTTEIRSAANNEIAVDSTKSTSSTW